MPSDLGRAPVISQLFPQVPQVFSLVPVLLLLAACLPGMHTAVMGLPPPAEINLLESLHLHNNNFAGVQQKPGPHAASPAAFFTGSSRSVYYSTSIRDSVTKLIKSSKEFTFLTSIRQNRQNTGTIFAFSYGKYQNYRYLEVQSSGRQDVIRVHYSPQTSSMSWRPGMAGTPDQSVRVETFQLRLADDSWHRLAVIVSGDQIEVLLDCRSVHRRVVAPIDTSFLLPEETVRQEGNLTLWLGQRNEANFLFKGYLQETKLVAGHHGFLVQCPNSDTSCPTCGQFQQLEDTVSQLQQYIKELNSRLLKAEEKISELEGCECSKSCSLPNGQGIRGHEETWIEGCDNFTCFGGKISQVPFTCEPVNCAKPDPPGPGECCSTCKDPCPANEVIDKNLTHGEKYHPVKCHTCECNNGAAECTPINCPDLPCPESQHIYEDGVCCPLCQETDFCSRGHNCHQWAKCTDQIFNYTCDCNQGFQGDGFYCDDVNECNEIGGRYGNHCPIEHGRCINLVGSYTCDCESGYHLDTTNTSCLPVNPCQTGEHTCSKDASCTFSGDNYICQCNQGFMGDGHQCMPVCDIPCHNGGSCIAPNVCQCAPGYAGKNCQEDIDECLLGEDFHKCTGDSVCINRVGWFYCACKRGFVSYHNPLNGSTTCRDKDECEMQIHTCHKSALCLNTIGSYSCYCGDKSNDQCSTDCVVDRTHHSDGTSWVDGCNSCQCDSGRVTCSQVNCDCSVPGTDRGCCPECYDKRTCLHQDVPGLKYNSGQKWAYQCMECECLHGEIDCWPQDCPPTPCLVPARSPGSCCPTCPGQDELCRVGGGGQPGGNSSCVHGGLMHQEGDSWQLPYSDCASCQCKDGNVFCTIEPSCGLVGLLPKQPYWQRRQQYYQQGAGRTSGSDRTDLSTKESNTPIPAVVADVTELPDLFIENVTIPQSEHDTVVPVSSEKEHKRGNSGQRQALHRRKPRRISPLRSNTFSSKHIERYVLHSDISGQSQNRANVEQVENTVTYEGDGR